MLFFTQDEYGTATALLEASLAQYQHAHDTAGVAMLCGHLAEVALSQGHYDQAIARLDACITHAEACGNTAQLASALVSLAVVHGWRVLGFHWMYNWAQFSLFGLDVTPQNTPGGTLIDLRYTADVPQVTAGVVAEDGLLTSVFALIGIGTLLVLATQRRRRVKSVVAEHSIAWFYVERHHARASPDNLAVPALHDALPCCINGDASNTTRIATYHCQPLSSRTRCAQ